MEIYTSTIIANILIELDKEVVSYDEIIKYANVIKYKLKANNYTFDKIDESEINNFCKLFIAYVKNDRLFHTVTISRFDKMCKMFRNNQDPKLIELFKKPYKYILPFIYEDKYIEGMFRNENIFKDYEFFKNHKSGYTIVDLNKMSDEELEYALSDSNLKINKVYNLEDLEKIISVFENQELIDYFNLHTLNNREDYKLFKSNYDIASSNGEKIKNIGKSLEYKIDHTSKS